METIIICCYICKKILMESQGRIKEKAFIAALCDQCKKGKDVYISEDRTEMQFQEIIKGL